MQRNIQNAAFRQTLENHLSMLTPYRNKADEFTAKVRVEGYSNIPYTIAGLLKLAAIALDPEGNSDASAYDIINTLEMALSLLPYEEFELLDILYIELLSYPETGETAVEAFAFNYSTERLLPNTERLRNHQL
jgi:hypothetical protein